MADVSSVTSLLATAQEGFTTTLATTAASGATTVVLNSVAGYTNGDIVVLVVDPEDSDKKQVFTGTVDTSGVQITGVVWTEGTNQTHSAGATVADYATASHYNIVSKALKVVLNQDGTLQDDLITNAKLDTTTGELGGAWDTWSPTLSGFSGTPTVVARYTQVGKTVKCLIYVNGTSNATTKYFTYPVAPATWQDGISPTTFITNEASTYVGAIFHRTSTPNMQVYRGFNQATATSPVTPWTASGTVTFQGYFEYEAA